METFYDGKGINVVKLNANFDALKNQTNANETAIQNIANTALLKDGSNVTPEMIQKFKQDTVTSLSTSGTINLSDGGDYILTLTGNGTVLLPTITNDSFSHTITMIVMGGSFSLNMSAATPVLNPTIDIARPYSVMFVFNKVDNKWYYFLGQ